MSRRLAPEPPSETVDLLRRVAVEAVISVVVDIKAGDDGSDGRQPFYRVIDRAFALSAIDGRVPPVPAAVNPRGDAELAEALDVLRGAIPGLVDEWRALLDERDDSDPVWRVDALELKLADAEAAGAALGSPDAR